MCSPGLHYFTVVKCAAGLQLGTSWGHPGESDISQVARLQNVVNDAVVVFLRLLRGQSGVLALGKSC